MLRIIKIIILAVCVAYLVIFSVSNIEVVTFKPFMNIVVYNIPLYLLVLIVLFIGMVVGMVAVYTKSATDTFKIRKLNKEIKACHQEIERLQKLTSLKKKKKQK